MPTTTTYDEVVTMFHSMPMTTRVIGDKLEEQYFLAALGEYELAVGDLGYDSTGRVFCDAKPYHIIYTLALMMYTRYLTQELSRVLKLNGISGKDVTMTGIPAAKTKTYDELRAELTRVEQLLYKQSTHCWA